MAGIRELRNPSETRSAPIHALLRQRWSPRAFSSRPVDQGTLRALFEAARWAPSSYNAQPWSFIVATKDDPTAHERLLSALLPQNAEWARNAAVLVLAIAEKTLPATGDPNPYAFYDVGQAVAQMVVEATARGLVAHQMGGFVRERAREIFALPRDLEPVVVIAIGYASEADALPDAWRRVERAPRQRKPLDEFVFAGRWGAVAPLVQPAAAGEPEPLSDEEIHRGFAGRRDAIFSQGGRHDQTDQIR